MKALPRYSLSSLCVIVYLVIAQPVWAEMTVHFIDVGQGGGVLIEKDGKHILEISTKCEPEEAFQVGIEFKTFLAGHGIDLDAKQETKTKTAMQKFKAEHEKRPRARKMGRAARQPAERASRPG